MRSAAIRAGRSKRKTSIISRKSPIDFLRPTVRRPPRGRLFLHGARRKGPLFGRFLVFRGRSRAARRRCTLSLSRRPHRTGQRLVLLFGRKRRPVSGGGNSVLRRRWNGRG